MDYNLRTYRKENNDMEKVSFYISTIGIIACLMNPTILSAEECFNSSGKLNEDAQTIRLKTRDMGWSVGKPSSLAAATIIEGKVKLYPKDNVEVCLREHGGDLQIKAQSKSEDAGKAKWHVIRSRKKIPGKVATYSCLR
jgi:hypothetical protein